ncbi:MAG TPA: DnaJ C-terminal domain-containing protein [Geminicoccaceae bacterium]|nr:DnaJ C-terminal domain-containing protein [Geminicoccaceae bacterium]
MQDPYRVLNVPREAGQAAIKAAYRDLAKRLHPDRNPGDARAEQRFKQVTRAYELLRDPAKRAKFDRGLIDADGKPQFGFGHFGFGRGAAAGGAAAARPDGSGAARGAEGLFEKIFGGAFGRDTGGASFEDLRAAAQAGRRPRRGEDRRCRLEVDFLLAARGGKQRLDLDGRVIEVDIPPGTEDGKVLRLKAQGGAAPPGGAPGDALVTVAVRPHERFSRQGRDVHLELPISLSEALQGAKVTVPTIDGPVRISVPPGSNSGRSLRLKGRGVAAPGTPRGDQYVRLVVMLPDRPDPELAEYVRRWAEKHPYDPRGDLEEA